MTTEAAVSRGLSRASTSLSGSASSGHPLLRRNHSISMTSNWRDGSGYGRPLKSETEQDDSVSVISLEPSNNSVNGRMNLHKSQVQLPALNTRSKTTSFEQKLREMQPAISTRDQRTSSRGGDPSVQELLDALREKMKTSFVELRKRFSDNDPESKGAVTREALLRLVTTATGKAVTVNQLNKLLDHLGIGNKKTIGFSEFAGKLCQNADDFRWLNSRCPSRDGQNGRPATKDQARSLALPMKPASRGQVVEFETNRMSVDKPNDATDGKLGVIREHSTENNQDEESHALPAYTMPPKTQPFIPKSNEPVLPLGGTLRAPAVAESRGDANCDVAEDDNRNRVVRSAEEVDSQVKHLFAIRYADVERAFRELDELNSNSLSIDSMVILFGKLNLDPPITRDEIEVHLWPRFFLRDRSKLDYWEFCRHFMYSKETAAFPNSKRHPPRKGDADYLLRSLEVNSDTDLVRSCVRTKIDMFMDQLRTGFLELDPHRTGTISQTDFRKMLLDLESEINDYEIEKLCQRYKAPGQPDRVRYVEFLAPFTARRFPNDHTSQQDKMDFVFTRTTPRPDDKSTSNGVLAFKVTRRFVTQHKAKLLQKSAQLKRAFTALDQNESGFLGISELRTTLKLIGEIEVGSEDWFELLNELDTHMTGNVNYRKLLSLIEEQRPLKGGQKKKESKPSTKGSMKK